MICRIGWAADMWEVNGISISDGLGKLSWEFAKSCFEEHSDLRGTRMLIVVAVYEAVWMYGSRSVMLD